jgi:Protein of unknown function (DUF3641)
MSYLETLSRREILFDERCYGCTAGTGSSCGGATTKGAQE